MRDGCTNRRSEAKYEVKQIIFAGVREKEVHKAFLSRTEYPRIVFFLARYLTVSVVLVVW